MNRALSQMSYIKTVEPLSVCPLCNIKRVPQIMVLVDRFTKFERLLVSNSAEMTSENEQYSMCFQSLRDKPSYSNGVRHSCNFLKTSVSQKLQEISPECLSVKDNHSPVLIGENRPKALYSFHSDTITILVRREPPLVKKPCVIVRPAIIASLRKRPKLRQQGASFNSPKTDSLMCRSYVPIWILTGDHGQEKSAHLGHGALIRPKLICHSKEFIRITPIHGLVKTQPRGQIRRVICWSDDSPSIHPFFYPAEASRRVRVSVADEVCEMIYLCGGERHVSDDLADSSRIAFTHKPK